MGFNRLIHHVYSSDTGLWLSQRDALMEPQITSRPVPSAPAVLRLALFLTRCLPAFGQKGLQSLD
jgi:hypothetical protein